MISIVSKSHFAPFNIATEEYILRHLGQEAFLLYINEPSIIVGMHQNSIAEINYEWVREHNIPVVRRLTGGGTVFHDLGNLNFCFIMTAKEDSPWNFERYTAPILEVLGELGVDARLQGRNDLTIDGLKFSGNAKLVERGKILQHGTILYSSRLVDLSAALKVNPLKFSDKAVKSIRARVTNVTDHLKEAVPLEEFIVKVTARIHIDYPEIEDYELTDEDIKEIQKLCDEKYSTWDWNFGKSPKYNFSNVVRTASGTIEAYLDVQAGRIETVKIYGDFFSNRSPHEFEAEFAGVEHQEQAIRAKLEELPLSEYFGLVSAAELLPLFF